MQQISPELLHGSASELCCKTQQVILESAVGQITGANEIRDFNNSLHRFLQAAASFSAQSLLMNNAVIIKKAGSAFKFADGTS